MSLVDPVELLLLNLEGAFDPSYVFLYIDREVALGGLRERTGQDFGYDSNRWRQWLQDNNYPR